MLTTKEKAGKVFKHTRTFPKKMPCKIRRSAFAHRKGRKARRYFHIWNAGEDTEDVGFATEAKSNC